MTPIAHKKRPHSSMPNANQLRIIGGRWRGTKLNFPRVAAIRPTPDRVRETLFNWLQHDIVNARCLDLFAGSGALGMEALSRGASSVIFVDREPLIGSYLRDTLQRVQCTQAEVLITDAVQFLQRDATVCNVVFLDPPFSAASNHQLLSELCVQLEEHGWLAPQGYIYIECPSELGSPASIPRWPVNWIVHRSKQAGQVGYHLAKRTLITANEQLV